MFFSGSHGRVKGLLFTLEGIDGSGKSTASGILASRLAEVMPGRRFVFTAEPTAGEAGRILRMHLSRTSNQNEDVSSVDRMEELFLFLADHADHLSKTVIPALKDGSIVISDRYADSTAAYQGVTLKGIVPDPVKWIQNVSRPWNVVPDLTIFFAVDPAHSLRRIRSRASVEKFEKEVFLREVDRNFRRIAEIDPDRYAIIDASKKAEEVSEKALSLILEKIDMSA